MNVNLVIDNLIIDEGVIAANKKIEFKTAVEIELQQLLTKANNNADSYSENNIARLNAGILTLVPDSPMTLTARKIATIVFESMNRELR